MRKYLTNRLFTILAMLPLAALVAAVALFEPGRPAPAHANETGIWAHCTRGWDLRIAQPKTRPTESENYKAIIRTDNRGNGLIRGHWYTVAGTADTSDYVDVQGQYGEGHGVVIGEFATRNDRYPERQERFTIRFVNAASGGENAECPITITDNDEGAHSVRITSSPADGQTYRIGETIEFRLDFTRWVELEGEVLLGFRIGEEGGASWRTADYHRGSRSDTMYFRYQVQPGDFDEDGISMDGGYVDENGRAHGFDGSGKIVPVGGESLYGRLSPWFRGFGDQAGHHVDARVTVTDLEVTSTPNSEGYYGLGDEIQLSMSFSREVVVEGDVMLNLRVGDKSGNWRGAMYQSGSGTDTLVFAYTVRDGDKDTNGISVDSSWVDADGVRHGYGGSGAMKVEGFVFTPRYGGLDDQPDHLVDGETPSISRVSIVHRAGSRDGYGVGDMIVVYVNFDEYVLTLGTPQITLDFDGEAKTASYVPPPDAWDPLTGAYSPIPKPFAAFIYIVRVGDADADGFTIAANALDLNGGSMQDAADNDADLSHDVLPASPENQVSAPGGL